MARNLKDDHSSFDFGSCHRQGVVRSVESGIAALTNDYEYFPARPVGVVRFQVFEADGTVADKGPS